MGLISYAKSTSLAQRARSLKSAANSAAFVLKRSVRLEPEHYDPNLERGRAVSLFKRHVELFEVETTSYCNRTCSFCPNSFIDRRSEKTLMPEACWEAILRDLRDTDYDGHFMWSRYSEPLSEERIVERIAEVRRAAPRAFICINSNGDYLDGEYLAKLVAAGLDRLWVDIYMPDAEVYDLEAAKKHNDRFFKQIGAQPTILGADPELRGKVELSGIEITTVVRNSASVKAHMSSRGGLVQLERKVSRVGPCYAPFKHLVIDWDGSVVVCCHVRSDATEHKEAVVAKVGTEGVGPVEAYVALAGWRDSLKGFGEKGGPCATCDVREVPPTWLARTVASTLAEETLPGVREAKRAAQTVMGKSSGYFG